jgi:hypothetical protein
MSKANPNDDKISATVTKTQDRITFYARDTGDDIAMPSDLDNIHAYIDSMLKRAHAEGYKVGMADGNAVGRAELEAEQEMEYRKKYDPDHEDMYDDIPMLTDQAIERMGDTQRGK